MYSYNSKSSQWPQSISLHPHMKKPLSAFTIASNWLLNLPQAAFTVPLDRRDNTAITQVTSWTLALQEAWLVSLSTALHAWLSTGSHYGELGGHMFGLVLLKKLSDSHFQLFPEFWHAAKSCCHRYDRPGAEPRSPPRACPPFSAAPYSHLIWAGDLPWRCGEAWHRPSVWFGLFINKYLH